MSIALLVILAIASVVLIVSVMLQDGGNSGLSGSITGGAEQLFGHKKAKGMQATLSKVTVVCAVLFILCSIVLTMID